MNNKKYALASCTIIKNEAKYLKEWIEFHNLIGFDHMYLYDNGSEDNSKEIIQPYIDNEFITLIDFPGKAKQMEAYNHCLNNYRNEMSWLAVIDADEFIIPVDRANVKQAMSDILERASKIFPNQGYDPTSMESYLAGISLSWIYYGNSYHQNYVPGLLFENYLNRIKFDHNDSWYKQIYLVDNITKIINPHYTIPNNRCVFIDEDGAIVSPRMKAPMTKGNYLRVNHYTTRSYNEHLFKLNQRGFADGLVVPEFQKQMLLDQGNREFNEVFDPITLRYVSALKERGCK